MVDVHAYRGLRSAANNAYRIHNAYFGESGNDRIDPQVPKAPFQSGGPACVTQVRGLGA